jgi:hypothetical protein
MKKLFLALLAMATALAITPAASASTITWTDWTSASAGNPGNASGTMGGITVTYAGQTSGLGSLYAPSIGQTLYPGSTSSNWGPSTSYVGGVVGNAPPTNYDSVALEGGSPLEETITFSSSVTDPVVAIWSLGQGGTTAAFNFSDPFSIVACGPSAEYGGGCITQSINNVLGVEGNGVIEFNGTYSSLTFTTPDTENWYAFTVGNPVPEPSSLLLLGTGLLGLAFVAFRRAKASGLTLGN